MTNCRKWMFDQHGSFLEERMDPDSGLLDKLLANRTLSRIEYSNIKGHQSFCERNARLLDYICQTEKYDNLIGALRDTRQTHLVNYLNGNGERKSEYGGDWPLTENEISILDTNQESLVDLVDCSELLVRLYSAQVINGKQRVTTSSEPNDLKRNEILLDIIRRGSIDDYRQVVRCLHESNQSHVAMLLDKGGVVVRVHANLGNNKDADHTEDDIITRFTDVLSGKSLDEASHILKEIELKVIAAKKGHSVVLYVYCRTAKELTYLYEMYLSGDLRSIVEKLFSQLLFYSTTAEYMYAEVTAENLKDVVECALTQLLYRSQMKGLTVTLPTTEYKKCRSYFSDECIIIRAVGLFDVDERITERREYKELINIVPFEKVKDDPYSMMLSFEEGDYMMTAAPENIGDNGDWWKVEHLGNGRIGYIPRKRVVIDYNQEATSRNVRPTTSRKAASSWTTMNFLPLELLDIILQKSYLHYALNRDSFKDQSDRLLVTRLTAVDRCWFERLRKRKFRRIIWRRLSIAFNKIHRVIFILRSNQSFLMETMDLRKGLIDKLRLCDCLTDVQSRLLNRQKVVSGKRKLISRNNSSDLLHVIRSCDDTKRSDFFRCFRRSDQKLITKVIDNGGVALKLNLCGKDAEKLQQLSKRLNNLNDKSTLRSYQMERAISELNASGIEIFQSQMDRQSVLCIWCKSQMGLENLHKLCESNSIADIIGDLTKLASSAPKVIGSRMIDLDIDQFKKAVVVCPIFVRFTARLVVNKNEAVLGVTILRQEICVLCHNYYSSPPAIHVFQNRNPFRLNAKINISVVNDPDDLGSSDEHNCFFVLDSGDKCVWKIARQTGDSHKFLQLQSNPLFHYQSRLSVSCDGQQLLILTHRPLEIYRTFGTEGAAHKPLFIVPLPSDIKYPRHAVETSSGHFVIVHHRLKQDFTETVWSVEKKEEEKEEEQEEEEEEKEEFVISKVTRDGRLVVRRFVPQNKTQELNDPRYLALDSDDRVFVADKGKHRVILLDSDLTWIRILCQTENEGDVRKLCYDKVERQLIVTGYLRQREVSIYSCSDVQPT